MIVLDGFNAKDIDNDVFDAGANKIYTVLDGLPGFVIFVVLFGADLDQTNGDGNSDGDVPADLHEQEDVQVPDGDPGQPNGEDNADVDVPADVQVHHDIQVPDGDWFLIGVNEVNNALIYLSPEGVIHVIQYVPPELRGG